MIVTNSTIDAITRGLIKYRLITHASANAIGSEMLRLNHLAEAGQADHPDDERNVVAAFYPYTRTPFERKVKRSVLDGAIVAWQMEIIGLANTENMPVVDLVARLYRRNLERIQQQDPMYLPSAYGTVIDDTDEGREAAMIRTREEREEENRQRLAERMAAVAAERAEREARQAAERAANPTSSDDEDFDDEDDYDDEDIDPEEY